jgi:hypothetical protein
MKSILSYRFKATTLLLCLLVATYSSCKKTIVEPVEPEPTPVEITTALIKGPAWVMSGVTVDGVVLDLYKNLNISFTADADGKNGKYTSVNGGVLWPASGTWTYKTDEAKAMVRDDGLEITIDALTEKTMTISFTRTGDTVFEDGGRTKAVGGKHVLTLGR